jgi:hypothetical protein
VNERRQSAPTQETMMQHEVCLRRIQQHFVQAVCSCGWVAAARRSESLAAEEGRDHAILYNGAFSGEIL